MSGTRLPVEVGDINLMPWAVTIPTAKNRMVEVRRKRSDDQSRLPWSHL
ncbi:hypothetical protein LSH36_669g01008 [Paralvinella palmiformis]|uniref:Uncharacterized protein n=1 Tax=Paralvinella palmiformis TaxID=53620 RepID=A0AAD9MWH9_9ANNE|nr:hypothetical protein LSH36_669g01008 [Paralvinella palmiformis]